MVPVQATNADFANKLYMTPEVASSGRFAKPKLDQTGFTIQHYAGAVTYKTENFLAKNKDFVVAEHQQLMQNSSQAFVRALFPPDAEDQQPEKVTPAAPPNFHWTCVKKRFSHTPGQALGSATQHDRLMPAAVAPCPLVSRGTHC